MANNYTKLIRIFGLGVVLIPIPKGKKGPRIKRWQHKTLADMADPAYVARLERSCNIGVLLGSGLISIDFDTEDAAREFLDLNPNLRSSFITRGARGCNVWLFIEGGYPERTTFIKGPSGETWCEWRADGGLTVAAGIHPSGKAYEIVNEAAPLKVRFAEIRWPEWLHPSAFGGANGRSTTNGGDKSCDADPLPLSHLCLDHSITRKLHHSITTSLHHDEGELGGEGVFRLVGHEIEDSMRAAKEFTDAKPKLATLYKQLVGDLRDPAPHRRNEELMKLTSFLYRAVSFRVARIYAEQFYLENQHLWRDPLCEHMNQFDRAWTGNEQSYPTELNAVELRRYMLLADDDQRAVFRICRDFAFRVGKRSMPPPYFSVPVGHLGLRIDGEPGRDSAFDNVLKKVFVRYQIIEITDPGMPRMPGLKGVVRTYRWLLTEE